jgi:hypothetical protein
MVDEGFAVHLRRVDQPFGGEAGVVVDLGRGVLGLGDQRGGALLGLDEVSGGALLALGEDLGTSFLGLGGDPAGLLVSRTQDRGALGTERARQRCLVEGGVGGLSVGLAQLVLEFADARLEMAHLSGDRFEVHAHLVRVETALAQGRKVHAGNLGRRRARGGEDSAFVHSFKTTASDRRESA